MSTRASSRPGETSAHAGEEALLARVRSWEPERLHRALRDRPDLATPPPSSLTAMITRATSESSVNRALASLDRPTLTVAQALVLLGAAHTPVSAAQLTDAVGFEPAGALTLLGDRLLAVPVPEGNLVPGALVALLSERPLGLGPPLRALGVPASHGYPTTTAAVHAVLAQAPDGAHRVLEAMTWGPASGSFSQTPAPVQWLIDARILVRTSPTQVALPREVALALRGGRLARDIPLEPPVAPSPERDARSVAAESAQAAEAIWHDLATLVDLWSRTPPPVLRGGGLGVRDLRALATALQATPTRAALVAELAGMLSLVGHHHSGDRLVWAPTRTAPARTSGPLPQRWALLAETWLESSRAPWLVGSRTEKGAVRAALEPELHRSWAADVRQQVLRALTRFPRGAAPDADAVHAHLEWYAPRSAPPLSTVTAVLDEAADLGLTGAGALSTAGALLATEPPPALEDLAAAFAADLPDAVGEVLIQGDLTGVVPGRPQEELAILLDQVAEVESRGSAMTVRFTAESVRRALDAGLEAEAVLADLDRRSPTGVPQPLEYLVRDAARLHGRLRVGRAGSFLRTQDAGTLAAVLGDQALGALGLRELAPTVLVSTASPAELAQAVRTAGHSVLIEGPDGSTVSAETDRVYATRGLPPAPSTRTLAADPDAVAAVVQRMTSGEQATVSGRSEDPSQIVRALHRAHERGATLSMVIAGANGATRRHRIRPLHLGSGRMRVLDLQSQAEITVAAHRIVSVDEEHTAD